MYCRFDNVHSKLRISFFSGSLVKGDSYTIPFYVSTCVCCVGALLTSVSKFVGNNKKCEEIEICEGELDTSKDNENEIAGDSKSHNFVSSV